MLRTAPNTKVETKFRLRCELENRLSFAAGRPRRLVTQDESLHFFMRSKAGDLVITGRHQCGVNSSTRSPLCQVIIAIARRYLLSMVRAFGPA